MEHMGIDLKEFLSQYQGEKLSFEHLSSMIYNLLCAVKFIHSHNIIHRDIKPSNVLINENCNIKLCDFGLARTLPESSFGKGSGNTKRVRDGLHKNKSEFDCLDRKDIRQKIEKKLMSSKSQRKEKKRSFSNHVGSRWCRAPEILLCEKQYDQASDMWSVGCIIYEILQTFALKD